MMMITSRSNFLGPSGMNKRCSTTKPNGQDPSEPKQNRSNEFSTRNETVGNESPSNLSDDGPPAIDQVPIQSPDMGELELSGETKSKSSNENENESNQKPEDTDIEHGIYYTIQHLILKNNQNITTRIKIKFIESISIIPVIDDEIDLPSDGATTFSISTTLSAVNVQPSQSGKLKETCNFPIYSTFLLLRAFRFFKIF